MAEFACRIAMTSGEIVERIYTAENESALRRELERKDFHVLEVKKAGGAASAIASLIPFRAGVSQRVCGFC